MAHSIRAPFPGFDCRSYQQRKGFAVALPCENANESLAGWWSSRAQGLTKNGKNGRVRFYEYPFGTIRNRSISGTKGLNR